MESEASFDEEDEENERNKSINDNNEYTGWDQ